MNSTLPIGNTFLPGSNNTTSLKRTRSSGVLSRKFDPSSAPPLPTINGELILQVFTHKSLRRSDVSPKDHGDNEKLVLLGRPVLEMAITHSLFCKRPLLRAHEISECRQYLLSSGMVEDWVAFYGLLSKVRCHRDAFPTLNSAKEIHGIFYAYVGAVYVSSGPQASNEWLWALLEQELEILWDHIDRKDTSYTPLTPPSKKAKGEYESPSMPARTQYPSHQPPMYTQQHNMMYTQQFNAAQPVATPKPQFVPNPMAPAQPTLPFLPLFNQAAMQRRVNVEYQAEFSGPSHAGRWAVKCIVNGLCKGEGSANSKQAAKEEAARNAYYSMGWT